MASSKTPKNSIKFKTNDFDIDSGLDFPDFDFNSPEGKDDRNPVSKVAGATLKGALGAVMSPSIIRSTIDRSMPKEYGQAASLLGEGTSTLGDLYDHAGKELKPAINDIKNITRQVLPKVEGVLPKKLAEILKKASAQNKGLSDQLNQERMRSDQLAMELGVIFKAQAENDDLKTEAQDKKDQLKEGIDQVRHRDQLGALGAIAQSLQQLTNYQDKVLANYQKKSLELQFRQYFATVDILEETRKASADTKGQLAGILKNTGLPEFVKIKESERFQEIARNKFMGNLQESLFGDSSEYIKRFMGNISKSLKEKITDFGNSASSITGMAEMATSMGGGGGSAAETIGGFVGGEMGRRGVQKGQDWLKGKLEKNPNIQKGAENLGYRMRNAGQLLNDHLDGDSNWGPLNFVKNFLAETKPKTAGDTAMQVDSLLQMNEPAVYSNAAQKSIVEIIPGFLSRIHAELAMTRTGKTTGLLSYDYSTNKFTTSDQLAGAVRSTIVSKQSQEQTGQRLNELLKLVDPEGQFTKEQQDLFKKQILTVSLKRQSTDAAKMTTSGMWGAGANGQSIQNAFSKLFETNYQGKRGSSLQAIQNQNAFSDQVRGLTTGMDDPRAMIQAMVNAGQGELLQEAGILDEKGEISVANLNKMLMGQYEPAPPQAMSSTAKRRRGARPVNRTTNVYNQQSYAPEQIDTVSLNESLNKLNDTLGARNTIDYQKAIAESVKNIEERVTKGLFVYGNTTGQFMSGQELGEKPAPAGGKGFFKMSLGDLFRKLPGMGVDVLRRGSQLVGLATSGAANIAGRGLGLGRDLLGMGLDKSKQLFADIYVGNEIGPRLTRAKMDAGEYLDQATGKAIKGLSDIKGTIIDKDGNIVLDAKEIKNAFLKGKPVQTLMRAITRAGGMISNLASTVSGFVGNSVGGIYGLAMRATTKAWEIGSKYLPAFDVYVKGEKEPVLFATMMKMGKYFSEKDGKTIRHPSDIDGPLVDEQGNYVLTKEQIETGLVDVHGRPIGSKLGHAVSAVLGIGKGLVTKAFGALKGLGEKAKSLVSGVGQYLHTLFGGIFGMNGEYLDTSKKSLDVQLEILHLLQERLPKRNKVVGDTDGDGIRDGSAQDILRKRAEEEEKDKPVADQARDAGSKGLLGTLASLFKGRKGEESDEEKEDGDTFVLGGGEGGSEKGKGKGKAPRANTRWGRIKQGVGKAAGGLGKMGKGALALSGLGGLASFAGGALSVAGSMASAGLSLGAATLSGIGSLLGMAGPALASIFSAPVLLTALGVGAVAYGGYKLYQYATRKKLAPLSRVRYVQYGFNPTDEKYVQAVFSLEDELLPHVKLDGEKPSIDGKKLNFEKLIDLFGVDKKNPGALQNWIRWYNERFKPIFLAHVSALRGINATVKLSDADSSLKPAEKKQYLEAIAMPGGPYDKTASPFADLPYLPADATAVRSAVEIAKTELDKEGQPSSAEGAAGKAGGAAALAASTKSAANAAGVSVADKAATANTELSKGLSDLNNPSIATQSNGGVTATVSSMALGNYLFTGRQGQLDALTSIRYKAYGLVEMQANKVRSLRALELATEKLLTFTKDGAVYSNDIEALLELVKVDYGISGARSPAGLEWMKWAKSRFLPVFLNFAGMMNKLTGKKDVVSSELAIKPADAVSVANSIRATTAVYEGRNVPVWQVPYSPWEGYVLNNEEESTSENMQALTNAVKAVIVGEHKASTTKQEVADNMRRQEQERGGSSRRTISDTAGGAGLTYNKPTGPRREDSIRAALDANSSARPLNADGSGVRAAGDYVGGIQIQHPGQGTGGDINTIPNATGRGWEGVKDTILAAAKMTGTDPKLMATIAAIESGFDPNVKASTSSATGLYQFIAKTWNGMMNNHARKYGIAPGTPPTDARANALMGGEFLKENANAIKGAVKRPLTATDLYLAHFLGPAGAKQFLSANPNDPAAPVMAAAAKANPTIFYDKSMRPRTFGEIYDLFTKKIESRMKNFKLTGLDGSSTPTVQKSSAPEGAAAAGAVEGTAPKTSSSGGYGGSVEGATAPTAAPAPGDKPGASTPASPPAPSGSGYGGSVTKVSGTQALGQAAQAQPRTGVTTTSAAPAPAPAKEAPVEKTPVRTNNSFGGFQMNQTPTPKEITAQQKANDSELKVEVVNIGKTLVESLGAHRQAVTLLQQIANGISMSKPAGSAPSAAPAPQAAPKAAVDMTTNKW